MAKVIAGEGIYTVANPKTNLPASLFLVLQSGLCAGRFSGSPVSPAHVA